jgi:hypothetical protein
MPEETDDHVPKEDWISSCKGRNNQHTATAGSAHELGQTSKIEDEPLALGNPDCAVVRP